MRKRLLYADDEIEEREYEDWVYLSLKRELKRRGYESTEIVCARDAARTHELLSEVIFDYIILDIMMPYGKNPLAFIAKEPIYKTGLALAERLLKKEYKNNMDNRVVLLSGSAVKGVYKRLEEIAAEDKRFAYMEKPTSMLFVVKFLIGG